MTDARSGALHLVGVVRGERRRIPLRTDDARPGAVETVRFRDLAALLRPGPGALDGTDANDILAHHQAVEQAMHRGTIAPAPWGVIFANRDGAEELLRARYVELDQALALVEGRWELRLHVVPTQATAEVDGWTLHRGEVYEDLRRLSRAALSSAPSDEEAFAASFLVDRGASDAFTDRVQELRDRFPGLRLNVTGPWPPYDFVQFGLR